MLPALPGILWAKATGREQQGDRSSSWPFAQWPLWDSSHRPWLKFLKTQARPNGTQELEPEERGRHLDRNIWRMS